jgi:MSHA pilin protein MshD
MSIRRKNSGFTLIEIITTIVVVGIAATALLSVFSHMVKGSADPMIQQQATTIAEAYLEEILLKSYADPDGTEVGEVRATYDDIDDYNGLPNPDDVRDQNGDEIVLLADFSVSVNVVDSALNDILNTSGNAMLITITVTHSAIDPTVLHGYRTNY